MENVLLCACPAVCREADLGRLSLLPHLTTLQLAFSLRPPHLVQARGLQCAAPLCFHMPSFKAC